MDRCVQGEQEGLGNNSLLSAGVPGKEQVRRYPLHCFYSVYLTPVYRGGVKRRKRRRRHGVQMIKKAQKAGNHHVAKD